MKNLHGVLLESDVQQLLDTDRRMRSTAMELASKTMETARAIAALPGGADTLEARRKMGEMRVLADFLRTLQGRRETVIGMMARLGLSVADVYRTVRLNAEKEEEARKQCIG